MIKKKKIRLKLKRNKVKVSPLFYLSASCTTSNTFLHVKIKNSSFCLNAGLLGLRPRSTVHAAREITGKMCNWLHKKNMTRGILIFNGFSKCRKAIFQTLLRNGIKVLVLLDKTSIPHNGCRPRKQRRCRRKKKK